MSKDISPILEGWEFQPDRISVRRIKGLDGKPKIQLRLDMGLLQMEVEGRPDGQQPYGHESLLEYHLSLLEEHRRKSGTDKDFVLSHEDCVALMREAVQYYYRYLSLFHLQEFEGVVRDTERNLRVFDLVKQYAEEERDKWAFEQYRPYVLMMRARAKGALKLAEEDFDGALEEVEEAIEQIRTFFRECGREDMIEESQELKVLEEWREELKAKRPKGAREWLEEQLRLAVEQEEYERAARLRDQLRALDRQQRRSR
ncbi:MAG TPA: hypothetical protein EYP17_01695 [Candidatus Latescibacteria bacterium]|nr:hypothetical protein [Candidatus Latescibacterota bacterium]